MRWRTVILSIAALVAGSARAADVTNPAEVTGLRLARQGADVLLDWDDVTLEVLGGPETLGSYEVYRGDLQDVAGFVADRAGGSNRIGSPAASDLSDAGAAMDGAGHFWLVGAVDAAGNGGAVRPSRLLTPPRLGGTWTATTIELAWTAAAPAGEVAGYRIYWGRGPRSYEDSTTVDAATNLYSLSGLQPLVLYYISVTGIDREGNESAFSNEVRDAINGTWRFEAVDQAHLTPGQQTVETDVTFPFVLELQRVTLSVTADSRLTVPCSCSGGGECVGDPWDRTMTVYMKVPGGPHLELLHAITPFGTDSRTGPRVYTLDITPFAPLLSGTKTIGVNISTWVGDGWWVDVALIYSQNPVFASPKPPAAGIVPLFYNQYVDGGNQGGILPVSVAVPPDATRVLVRLFVSGHGGGDPAGDPDCIGPKDEFCQRNTRILVDGTPVWNDVPWWDCPDTCPNWNACGWTSCTYPRAGWCPGFTTCHNMGACDQDLDATAWLPAGETHDVRYEVENIGGVWSYSLVLYWYR